MKINHGIKIILLGLLVFHDAGHAWAQTARVFSQYNYYTLENEVTVKAELDRGAQIGKYKLSVSLKDDQPVYSENVDDNVLVVKLPLAPFPHGTTALRYIIYNGDVALQKGTVDIVRLSPKAHEVKIDLQTGGLISDGIPFFPVGFYCRPAAQLPEQEITHGFNLIAPYQSNLPATFAERKAYMDRCAQVGMKVQYAVNSLIGSGHNGARGLNMTDEEKFELLKKEVIAFRDHPALLSWYINDEPDGQGRPPKLLEKAYQIVHELDPYHPISMVFMLPSKFHLYRNGMDIAMTDPYPVPGPLAMVEQFVKQMNDDFGHDKSIWLVPQAFGGQEMWAREPTAKEIRLMTYLGLIYGVKGVQYYTHAAGNLNPQSVSAWSACSDIAVEINQVSAFLLSDEKTEWLVTNDSMVLAKSFPCNGNRIVMVVNKENKPKTISVALNTQQASVDKALLWFENREVVCSNNKIVDMIDALGTRVYFIPGSAKAGPARLFGGNLTMNPGFEKIVNPGLPIGSNTKRSFAEKTEAGASIFVDPNQHVEGMFSLRMTTPADSCGNRVRLLPIVLRAKNSYSVSIWAKAKAQDKMPLLRINVEGPGREKIFILGKDWQRYSFIFDPDSSYSSAIVSFDLLTAGTAWLDMVQVTPDPTVSYIINPDKTATVSIATTTTDAEIRYNSGARPGDAFNTFYRLSFSIDKATTIEAGLFVDNKRIAGARLFIPVNKALGKPVLLQSEYAPQYAGSGSTSFTDGLMASTAFKDNKWLGFSGRDVIATIDMQERVSIHSVAANFLCDPNSGIFLPPRLSLYVSDDGKNFKPAGVYINKEVAYIGEEPHLQTFTLDGKNIKARYVKIVATAFGEIPEGYLFKGTQSWIFTDEIMVE